MTEPDAGTDTSRIATRATDDGLGGFVVSGRKIWTTKAMESEVCLLLARTDDPDPSDDAGASTGSVCSSSISTRSTATSPRSRSSAATRWHRARWPTTSCRSKAGGWSANAGSGFQHILHGLNPERILLAAMACGIGEVALDGRSTMRTNVSCSTGRSAPTRRSLTHSRRRTCNSTLPVWPGATQRGGTTRAIECGEEANTAKYLAAEASFFAADQALQTHGGLGYATEYHVERYWREARLQRLAPVSQEMTCNYIAQQVLGLPRSY